MYRSSLSAGIPGDHVQATVINVLPTSDQKKERCSSDIDVVFCCDLYLGGADLV